MRPHNSVGGYRIYPTSPDFAEACDTAVAIQGQFREGMDRLNTEQQLTERQQRQVDQLDPNSEHAIDYRRLIAFSNRLWELALTKQQALNRLNDSGQFSAAQLGQHLNHCANRWQQFKSQLDEQA